MWPGKGVLNGAEMAQGASVTGWSGLGSVGPAGALWLIQRCCLCGPLDHWLPKDLSEQVSSLVVGHHRMVRQHGDSERLLPNPWMPKGVLPAAGADPQGGHGCFGMLWACSPRAGPWLAQVQCYPSI